MAYRDEKSRLLSTLPIWHCSMLYTSLTAQTIEYISNEQLQQIVIANLDWFDLIVAVQKVD